MARDSVAGRWHMKAAALVFAVPAVLLVMASSRPMVTAGTDRPTFAKDVLPILQRSCQQCHRPESVAPMSLLTYEQVRPWAQAIKHRTSLRNRMGVMPPWFIEKNVGIQRYKDDISLSEKEIAVLAEWADSGAPEGNRADAPPSLNFSGTDAWVFGQPDLVVDSPPLTMKANAPDWWGALPAVPTGLKEDRYVAAVEVKEISNVKGGVGGKFIFHHAGATVYKADGTMMGSIGGGHEVGRNAEFLEPNAAPLMTAGSQLAWTAIHSHANSQDTTARLRTGYKFHPKGYKPEFSVKVLMFGNHDIDLEPMKGGQEVHLYKVLASNFLLTTYEPHMHAAGVRMCLEAIWGQRVETLSCSGYDHNWVRVYKYADDAAPLLPKGTMLHVVAYFDNTPANRNVIDPRNWSGFGHRTVDNMANMLARGIELTDQQFQQQMAARRAKLGLTKGQTLIGCPLCGLDTRPTPPATAGN